MKEESTSQAGFIDYEKKRITRKEYDEAIRWAKEAGLTNLDIQGLF